MCACSPLIGQGTNDNERDTSDVAAETVTLVSCGRESQNVPARHFQCASVQFYTTVGIKAMMQFVTIYGKHTSLLCQVK